MSLNQRTLRTPVPLDRAVACGKLRSYAYPEDLKVERVVVDVVESDENRRNHHVSARRPRSLRPDEQRVAVLGRTPQQTDFRDRKRSRGIHWRQRHALVVDEVLPVRCDRAPWILGRVPPGHMQASADEAA